MGENALAWDDELATWLATSPDGNEFIRTRIRLSARDFPRQRSTTEIHDYSSGAGKRNYSVVNRKRQLTAASPGGPQARTGPSGVRAREVYILLLTLPDMYTSLESS